MAEERLEPTVHRWQRAAWIIGSAWWLLWLVCLARGGGTVDTLTDDPIGLDYIVFYSAGKSVLAGQSARLYDLDYQHALQHALTGWNKSNTYANPPQLALLVFAPLAALPYLAGWALWVGAGLYGVWRSLGWLGVEARGRAMATALSFFPLYQQTHDAQNTALTITLLSATWLLWSRGRSFAAGCTAALLLYKPHLTLGIGLLWLLEWRRSWRALAGFALVGAATAALCLLVAPTASRDYLHLVTHMMDHARWPTFPLWGVFSLRAFFHLLMPASPTAKSLLVALATAAGIGGFVAFWRAHRDQPALVFGAAVVLTLWVTPYLMTYDWALLVVPAALAWRHAPSLRARWVKLYAFVWAAAIVSVGAAALQIVKLPRTFHPAMPSLAAAAWAASAWLAPRRAA
jgi:hypothetical protein